MIPASLRTLALAAATCVAAASLTGCSFSAGTDNPGWEYAPDMYYSVPYEPYSQLHLNPINPGGTNMRQPAPGSIARENTLSEAPSPELAATYPLRKDDLQMAATRLRNPIPYNAENMAKGKYLYTAYCYPCHGEKGDGQGPVGAVYGGVANYNGAAYKGMTDGHIYHVIVHGKGRMWPHGHQILPRDRWLIVQYVNQLRGLSAPQTDASGYTYSTPSPTN